MAKKPTPKPQSAKSKPAKQASAKPAPKPAAKAPTKVPAKLAKPVDAKKADAKKPDQKRGEIKKPDVKKVDAKKPVAKATSKSPVVATNAAHAKGAVKPPAKVEAKPASKPPQKTPPKPAAKPEPKVAKPEAKVVKPEPKVAIKGGSPAAGPAGTAKPEPKKAVVPLGKTDVKAPPKKMKPPVVPVMPPGIGRLLDAGAVRKPLIPSGPKAAHVKPLGSHVGDGQPAEPAPIVKTNLSSEQLEEFKQLLLKKRQQLIGDITGMENEALRAGSGSLSNMPSHLAEQGSEAYDQSLSLNLAAADRKLLREIEDALNRIEEGTYGICELSLKPIKIERLRELPWARHSMESARELERMSMRKF